MTRYMFGFICVLALGAMAVVIGCGDPEGRGGIGGDGGSAGAAGLAGGGGAAGSVGVAGMGGAGGSAGTGGMTGHGGSGGVAGGGGTDLCQGVTCEDTECKTDGVCNPSDGMCGFTLAEDGTACGEGECLNGVCAPVGAFPCTEQGIRDAIAEGGGPHTFDCRGPTIVRPNFVIHIDNDVTLDGGGHLTVSGARYGDRSVFVVPVAVTAELRRMTVTNGFGYDGAGGINNDGTLTLTESTVMGNSGAFVGGIQNTGTLTLRRSTVSGNSAGWESFSGIGGILNLGTLVATTSQLSGNFETGIFNSGTATLTNCTVSDHEQQDCCDRGGCRVCGGTGIENLGTLTVSNCTFSENAGPAIFIDVRAGNVTLSGNAVHGYCAGDITSLGYNIESPDDTCGFDQPTDQVNISGDDLNLGPLEDNGGPTTTHALLPGSVAIDQIPEAECLDADGAPLTTDQRGVTRPQGIACDVGAFELQQ